MQVERSAHQHDSAIAAVASTHATEVFVLEVIGEGDGGLVRVGLGFGADLQLAVHHDPLGAQLEILIICEAQFAVDGQTMYGRRTVEDHVHVLLNGDDGIFARHLFVRPSGRIRPALRACRRGLLLSLNIGVSAE